jgi:5-methylcytosine-specific restriction protein B
MLSRFVSSLQAKSFVILSGLSGSGKTKLAESFAMYISESEEQWMLVPVGSDWTNRDSLLGFENTIAKTYSLPPYNVPEFIERAGKEENKTKPFFLILDEMNLSVVERYFADFLSAMESTNKEISLHQLEEQEDEKKKLPPKKLKLPPNLFIIGTVNIDESTYMFSPKVLDRANTIEFRLNETDVAAFLHKGAVTLNLDELVGKGKDMAASFVQNCRKELDEDLIEKIDDLLIKTFKPLKKAGAEFGYRTITEIRQLAAQLKQFIELDESSADTDGAMVETIFDIAILQKLLPKLHGSVGKLKAPLIALAELCFDEGKWDVKYLNTEIDERELSKGLRYPLSFEKIKSMYVRLLQNGFVSFAEA